MATGSGGDATRIALGAIAGLALLGGVWYAASLRTENRLLREQLAAHESAAAADETRLAPAGEPKPPAPGVAPTDPAPQRMLNDEQRAAMRSELSTEPGRKVWFEMQRRDPEVASFQREIEAVFRESGWEVAGIAEASYPIKAGIYFFAADADPAAHVLTALRGLQATGLDVFFGRGYRAYYEERKAEDPGFRGHEFAPEQEFVIVIGPSPRPAD